MFYYDQNGSVSSVLYNGVMYYYIKNLQGEIMQIVDENGNSIAIYAYDQWGKPTQMRQPTTTTVDLVNYNPFLYRGYVYDSDSGLYYLQSRYYDPVTGRFLNADIYCDTQTGSTLSTNMFAYCENNGVNFVDPSGTDAWWLQDTDGVCYMGHTSLLIQERPGRWWYFYWGKDKIQLVKIGTCTLKSLNEKKLKIKDNQGHVIYDGSYEKYSLIRGNFYHSLMYIYYNLMNQSPPFDLTKSIFINGNDKYKLITRNCMQVSMEVLNRGSFKANNRYNHLALSIASGFIIPNLAYNFYVSSQMMLVSAYGMSYAWNWLRSYL